MSHENTVRRWVAEDPDSRRLIKIVPRYPTRGHTCFDLKLHGLKCIAAVDDETISIAVIFRLHQLLSAAKERSFSGLFNHQKSGDV